ncbi:MAG: phage major tail tube protein [Hyphomicrobium sp.]
MRMIFGDFTLFLKADGKFSMIEKLELPELKWKTEEFNGGGFMGTREIALILEKLEMKFSSNSYDRGLLGVALQAPGGQSQWKVMGSMIVPGEAEKPFKALVTGALMEVKRGELQPGKKSDTDFVVKDITYYQEVQDGRELYEIDLMNQVLRVEGVDQMAARRRNLGRG